MSIEQLQLLLDAASAAGSGALQIVWLYFGMQVVDWIFHVGIIAAGMYFHYP